jgi:hypothetical protein
MNLLTDYDEEQHFLSPWLLCSLTLEEGTPSLMDSLVLGDKVLYGVPQLSSDTAA